MTHYSPILLQEIGCHRGLPTSRRKNRSIDAHYASKGSFIQIAFGATSSRMRSVSNLNGNEVFSSHCEFSFIAVPARYRPVRLQT